LTRTPANAIHIYTDGACRGNPGPGGWGALLIAGKHPKTMHGGDPETSNNRMELAGANEAPNARKGHSRSGLNTDSRYVMDGIKDWMPNWKNRGWKTAAKKPVKNQDLWLALDEAIARHEIEWRWVRGHDGNPGNETADALANQGIDEMQQRRS